MRKIIFALLALTLVGCEQKTQTASNGCPTLPPTASINRILDERFAALPKEYSMPSHQIVNYIVQAANCRSFIVYYWDNWPGRLRQKGQVVGQLVYSTDGVWRLDGDMVQ